MTEQQNQPGEKNFNMENTDLSNEAIKVWLEYGQAIIEAFGLNIESLIIAEPLNKILETTDEKKIKDFVSYIKQAIITLKKSE